MAVDILEGLATEAIGFAANTLEVEYKDGFEEVLASSGPIGFCIARFESSSQEAVRLTLRPSAGTQAGGARVARRHARRPEV